MQTKFCQSCPTTQKVDHAWCKVLKCSSTFTNISCPLASQLLCNKTHDVTICLLLHRTHISLLSLLVLNPIHQLFIAALPLTIAASQQLVEYKQWTMDSIITIDTLFSCINFIKAIGGLIIALLVPTHVNTTQHKPTLKKYVPWSAHGNTRTIHLFTQGGLFKLYTADVRMVLILKELHMPRVLNLWFATQKMRVWPKISFFG